MTRTGKVLWIMENVPAAVFVDELRNRHENGTCGNLERFLDYIIGKYDGAETAGEPSVPAQVSSGIVARLRLLADSIEENES